MVKSIFNTAVRTGSSYVIDRMMRSYGRDMLRLDPEAANAKLEATLNFAEWVSPVYPLLSVQWACHMANFATVMKRPGLESALGVALAHGEAAYAVDPVATRKAFQIAWLAGFDSGFSHHFSTMLHRLEPEMTPGPWGLRPEGQDRREREREAARTLWDRLGDFKHRVLHPPGPNDVTITMHGIIDPADKAGPLTRFEP